MLNIARLNNVLKQSSVRFRQTPNLRIDRWCTLELSQFNMCLAVTLAWSARTMTIQAPSISPPTLCTWDLLRRPPNIREFVSFLTLLVDDIPCYYQPNWNICSRKSIMWPAYQYTCLQLRCQSEFCEPLPWHQNPENALTRCSIPFG